MNPLRLTHSTHYTSIFTNATKTADPDFPTHHTSMPGIHTDATHVIRAAGDTIPHATAGHHLHPPTGTVARNGIKISSVGLWPAPAMLHPPGHLVPADPADWGL